MRNPYINIAQIHTSGLYDIGYNVRGYLVFTLLVLGVNSLLLEHCLPWVVSFFFLGQGP